MRATSIDRDAAAMMGIDIDRVIMFAFVLSGALAGAAGVLFALRTDLVPADGLHAGPLRVHGRRDRRDRVDPGRDARRASSSAPSRPLTVTYVTDWIGIPVGLSNLVIFSLLIVFMLVRPQGILGRPDIKKV